MVGELHYYRLEDLDRAGNRVMHGPVCVDWDGDGMPHEWEAAHGLDPTANNVEGDLDGDGYSDFQEYLAGTDPRNADTDADGMPDGWEVANGLDPLADNAGEDLDGDGYSSAEEYAEGTEPDDPKSYPEAPLSLIVRLGPSARGRICAMASDDSQEQWVKAGWSRYNEINGEARVATGDIDGDGLDEVVVGFGPGARGRFELLDDDLSHLGWGRIDRESYNEANGESWPACGDMDGDGRAEIIMGLGPGGRGRLEVFEFTSGQLVHKRWYRVNWPAYIRSNGETRPACGDIDADGKAELIIGLGPGGKGAFEVLDDDFSRLSWGRIERSRYNEANGESWPACGDIDGDGIDEIMMGLGPGGWGLVEVFNYETGLVRHRRWLRLDWASYKRRNGETRPACGDMDGAGKDEIIVGLGPGGKGRLEIFDDASSGCAHLAWRRIPWSAYNQRAGQTRPAWRE